MYVCGCHCTILSTFVSLKYSKFKVGEDAYSLNLNQLLIYLPVCLIVLFGTSVSLDLYHVVLVLLVLILVIFM